LASVEDSQRYGNPCDITDNHEIWNVIHSLGTYMKGVAHKKVRPAASLEHCQGITQYVNKQKKIRAAYGYVSLAYLFT
jgi:hypothetical protein